MTENTEILKKALSKTKEEVAGRTGGKILTKILPATTFYMAEPYHQKYYLRQYPNFMEEFEKLFDTPAEFEASTATARINGHLGGYGTLETLKAEVESYGLSDTSSKQLVQIVKSIRKQ